MSDHDVHEWVEVYENMVEGVANLALGDILARCSKSTCDAELLEPEILRRLNATERLSKTSAMAAATTSLRGGDVVSYEDLLAYASALEGEDG